MSRGSCAHAAWSTRASISRAFSKRNAWASPHCSNTFPPPPEGHRNMSDNAAIDPAVWRVIEDFEVRARRDDELWRSLSEEQLRARLDEFLLPVGRAAATLMNLIIKEGEARHILEVGSSYGYSTIWLAEAARAVGGKVISLELRPAKVEYARAQLARAQLENFVEFRIGDALDSIAQLPGPFDFVLLDIWKD